MLPKLLLKRHPTKALSLMMLCRFFCPFLVGMLLALKLIPQLQVFFQGNLMNIVLDVAQGVLGDLANDGTFSSFENLCCQIWGLTPGRVDHEYQKNKRRD